MTEAELYDGVIVEGTQDLALIVETLRRHQAGWCVIGGLAINAYVLPVYTRDLDLVAVAADLEPVLEDLRAVGFRTKDFPFSTNVQRRLAPGERPTHRLMVQFAKLKRYQPFVERAELREILGMPMPVAALEDVVQGKLWAWADPTRRASKHAKDEGDLLRLGEAHPHLRPLLPAELREKLERQDEMENQRPDDEDWN